MSRTLALAAAQLGPVNRDVRRADVVERLMVLLRAAHVRGCELVVFPELAFTRGVGVQASGWLGGAFLNSYERLSFIAGVERAWAEQSVGDVARLGVGYRAGLLTGYDERLASWADETPILPFVGLLGWAQVGRVSVDAFYVYRAITLEGSVAF